MQYLRYTPKHAESKSRRTRAVAPKRTDSMQNQLHALPEVQTGDTAKGNMASPGLGEVL